MIFTRLRIPSNARMRTEVHTRPLYSSPYGALIGLADDIQVTGMDNYLEFETSNSEALFLIEEIDLTGNRFYTYELSDIPWLSYFYPNRVRLRHPMPKETTNVLIDRQWYRGSILYDDISFTRTTSFKARVLIHPQERHNEYAKTKHI